MRYPSDRERPLRPRELNSVDDGEVALGVGPPEFHGVDGDPGAAYESVHFGADRVGVAEGWVGRELADRDMRHEVVEVGRIEAEDVEKKLKLYGPEHRFVIVTRHNGEALMIVAERAINAGA